MQQKNLQITLISFNLEAKDHKVIKFGPGTCQYVGCKILKALDIVFKKAVSLHGLHYWHVNACNYETISNVIRWSLQIVANLCEGVPTHLLLHILIVQK